MIESGPQNKKNATELKHEVNWRTECDLYSRCGGSAQSFCKERGLVYATFNYWRKKLSHAQKLARSTDEISLPVLMPKTSSATTEIRMTVNEIPISFASTVSPEFIARIIVAMSERGQC